LTFAPHVEDRRDLVVGQVTELEQDERGALVVGEPPQIVHQLAQVGSALNLLGQPIRDAAAVLRAVEADVLAARAQHRQAAIARDRVQPGPELDAAVAGAQRRVGRPEALLERVLGLLPAGQQLMAERQQAACVPVVDRLEGLVVAGAHARHETMVISAEHRPPYRRPTGSPVKRGSRHGASMTAVPTSVANSRRSFTRSVCAPTFTPQAPGATCFEDATEGRGRSGWGWGVRMGRFHAPDAKSSVTRGSDGVKGACGCTVS
jgi:hypothetical protein